MIVVTGGEGFIGGNLIKELNRRGAVGVISLDTKIEQPATICTWLVNHADEISCIYHLGAITDTTIMDEALFRTYNVDMSIYIWNLCATHDIPLVYASSAATYGDGEEGFDDEKTIFNLKPLNPYGWSKQLFDEIAFHAKINPPDWYGLKFFNVYGYGEAHKCNMASVVFHAYNQIKKTGEMKLFKSHRPDYNDGEQKRDFVYVDDVVDVCIWLMENKPMSGIYNVGTGKARSFNDLAKAVFKSLDTEENISYIDIPQKIRDKYQYFTEAKMQKLKLAGYMRKFHELEEGVNEYVNKLNNENC